VNLHWLSSQSTDGSKNRHLWTAIRGLMLAAQIGAIWLTLLAGRSPGQSHAPDVIGTSAKERTEVEPPGKDWVRLRYDDKENVLAM